MALQAFLEWLIVGLRWVHIVAILGWIGSSLYFMWLDSKLRAPAPARAQVDGEAWMGHGGGFYLVEKRRIAAGQVPRPVYWFRIEAAVTWVSGFLLLVLLYYWTGGLDLVDPERSSISPGAAVVLGLLSLPVAWLIYDRLWVSSLADGNGRAATVISAVLLLALVYGLCKVFTGRAAFIQIGAILGTNMVANVWTRIIPAQEEAVAATAVGRERNALMGIRARRRAVHNTYMTLPVIFTMIANHAPDTYSHRLNWLILLLLIVVGICARHLMLMIDRRQPTRWAWAPVLASIIALGYLTVPVSESAPDEARVPFTVVRGIVELRCASCHASYRAPEELMARAGTIKATTVVARTMPPKNNTRMTEEERALLGRWVDHGARTD